MTVRAIIALTATTIAGPIVVVSRPDTIVAVDQLVGYCSGRLSYSLLQRLLCSTAFCLAGKNWNGPAAASFRSRRQNHQYGR
jgi:hypothetical protein